MSPLTDCFDALRQTLMPNSRDSTRRTTVGSKPASFHCRWSPTLASHSFNFGLQPELEQREA